MIERHSIRALMLTTKPSILLMKILVSRPDGVVWITPGGGREADEEPLECLRREVKEETGLEEFEIGSLVWKRTHEFIFNGRVTKQSEDFYLVNVAEFSPQVRYLEEGDEQEGFIEFRWWQLEEISGSREVFVPRNLYRHLELLVKDGLPCHPISVGI